MKKKYVLIYKRKAEREMICHLLTVLPNKQKQTNYLYTHLPAPPTHIAHGVYAVSIIVLTAYTASL
jgi:hypothetical protein